MTAAIVRVPFNGDEILATEVDGKPRIILKPAIEALGLDFEAQRKKLARSAWATTSVTEVVGADGRNREMVTVDVRTFLMLMATIPATRVSAEARPTLVKYQSEVADAIEAYFTKGGAINPRASEKQLLDIATEAQAQMQVLRLGGGFLPEAWLRVKMQHVIARALGEAPETAPSDEPLTVGEYLEGLGVTGATLRSISGRFGTRMRAVYEEARGSKPKQVRRFVDGTTRNVYSYTEADRPLFDRVYAEFVAVAA